jgi:fructose 1,6-bisphosphatase
MRVNLLGEPQARRFVPHRLPEKELEFTTITPTVVNILAHTAPRLIVH